VDRRHFEKLKNRHISATLSPIAMKFCTTKHTDRVKILNFKKSKTADGRHFKNR